MTDQMKPAYDTRKQDAAKAATVSFDEIRKDLDTLQTDVVHLATNVRKVGMEKANDALSYVNKNVDSLKAQGTQTLKKVDGRVQSNPRQSLAIAFFSGVLATWLLGRKS